MLEHKIHMRKKTYSQTRSATLGKKKIALIACGVVIFGVASLFTLQKANLINLPFISNETPANTDSTINYGPPTAEEKKETEVFKDNQTKPETPAVSQKDSSQRTVVKPIISSYGQDIQNKAVSVSGYIPGIVEDGGLCTLTLKNGSQTITQDKTSTRDAKTVSCGFIDIERSRLSAGTWSATLTYKSSTSSGTSQPQSIEVI